MTSLMLLTLIAALLLMIAATVAAVLGVRSPRGTQALGVLAPIAGFILLMARQFTSASSGDLVSHVVPWIALAAALLVGLLNPSPRALVESLWNGGLLVLCASSPHPALQWMAVQACVLSFVLTASREQSVLDVLKNQPGLLVGSLLLGLGLLLPAGSSAVAPQIQIILVLCGLGALFGWFPFPRVVSTTADVVDVLASRALPALIAGMFLFRFLDRPIANESQGFLVAMVAVFSLIISSSRLLREDRLSRRVALTSLCTLSFLAIAAALTAWERSHDGRAWPNSNLPHGETLFVSILACETAALLLLVCGCRLMTCTASGRDFMEVLGGGAGRRPVAAAGLLCGVASLAGIPPLPGFWWRFSLMAACLLPHAQSSITKMIEPHAGFSLLLVSVLAALIINSLGQLKLFQEMLFVEPFRVRDARAPWRLAVAGALAFVMFLWIAAHPLTLGQLTVAVPPSASDVSPHESE